MIAFGGNFPSDEKLVLFLSSTIDDANVTATISYYENGTSENSITTVQVRLDDLWILWPLQVLPRHKRFFINTLYCVCFLFYLCFVRCLYSFCINLSSFFFNYFDSWAHAAVYTHTLFLNYTLICFLLISFINAKTLFFIRLLSTYHVCIGDELIRFNQGFVSNNSSVFHSSSICSAIDF